MNRGQDPEEAAGESFASWSARALFYFLLLEIEPRATIGEVSSPKQHPVSKQGTVIKPFYPTLPETHF